MFQADGRIDADSVLNLDHCLDYLLQAAMCHGDVGFMTYHWDMAQPRPFWKAAEHTCINWDSLHHWVAERRAPVYEPGLLIHPIFGPVFPDGGVKIPTIGKSRAILLCEVLADVRPDDIIWVVFRRWEGDDMIQQDKLQFWKEVWGTVAILSSANDVLPIKWPITLSILLHVFQSPSGYGKWGRRYSSFWVAN